MFKIVDRPIDATEARICCMTSWICASETKFGYSSGNSSSNCWPRAIMLGSNWSSSLSCPDSSGIRPSSRNISDARNGTNTSSTAAKRGTPRRSSIPTRLSSR